MRVVRGVWRAFALLRKCCFTLRTLNFFVQRSGLRDLYDKVAVGVRISEADTLRFVKSMILKMAGVIVLICAVLLASCNRGVSTNKFVYYFNNGTVYIQETSEAGKDTVYWHEANGQKKQFSGQQTYNSLAILPAINKEIPNGENPFKWKPAKEEVASSLKSFLKNYDSAISRLPDLGADAPLRQGETKDQAFLRNIDKLAGLYCSYDDQERGYQFPKSLWLP